MSSPKVILFTLMPYAQAEAINRQACDEFLQLARLVYNDCNRCVADLRASGRRLAFNPQMTPDQAEAEIQRIRGMKQDAGEAALLLAHAYWQNLKHEFGEEIQRQHAEWQTNQAALREAARQETRESVAKATEEIRRSIDNAQRTILKPTAPAGPSGQQQDPADKMLKLTHSIVALAGSSEEATRLKTAIKDLLENTPPSRQILQLEIFHSSAAQAQTFRRRVTALQCYERDKLSQYLDQLRVQAESLKNLLRFLSSEQERGFTRRIDQLTVVAQTTLSEVNAAEDLAALDKVTVAERIATSEKDCEQIRSEIQSAIQRKALLEKVTEILRQQGYLDVNEMTTLTADGIRRYFEDSEEPGNWVELRLQAADGSFSVESIRDETAQSEAARQSDRTCQERLCRSMDRVVESLSAEGKITILQDVAPNGNARVDSRLRTHRTDRTHQDGQRVVRSRTIDG